MNERRESRTAEDVQEPEQHTNLYRPRHTRGLPMLENKGLIDAGVCMWNAIVSFVKDPHGGLASLGWKQYNKNGEWPQSS